MTDVPLLEIDHVTKVFGRRRWPWQDPPAPAVEGVTLDMPRGGALGLVGESGSGKTTIARMAAGLLAPSAGEIRLDGTPGSRLSRRAVGRRVQMVFQEVGGSLNPRRTVRRTLTAPLQALLGLSGGALERRLAGLCAQVELDTALLDRYPHELSGGQMQRAAIARALAPEPDLLLLDEPTSALDVSVQARIVAMIRGLRETLDLAYMFVSHDLPVVEAVCDEIAVVHKGKLVEQGITRRVLHEPRDDYTKSLIASVPVPGKRRIVRGAAQAL